MNVNHINYRERESKPEAAGCPQRDRWFESISLQQRVRCEPDFRLLLRYRHAAWWALQVTLHAGRRALELREASRVAHGGGEPVTTHDFDRSDVDPQTAVPGHFQTLLDAARMRGIQQSSLRTAALHRQLDAVLLRVLPSRR
jgi:hypothetical protein